MAYCPIDIPVFSFYTLEFLRQRLNQVLPPVALPSQERLRQDVEREYERLSNKFAENLFNYLVLASYGEARHARRLCYAYIPEIEAGARGEAYQQAMRYTPRSILEQTRKLFLENWVDDGYGGDKWAVITKVAERYYSLPPAVFVDHCVDLSHNSGLAWDKAETGILGHPTIHRDEYIALLDLKRDAESIEDFLDAVYEMFGAEDVDSVHPWITSLKQLKEEALARGLTRQSRLVMFPSVWRLLRRAVTLGLVYGNPCYDYFLGDPVFIPVARGFGIYGVAEEPEKHFYEVKVEWGDWELPDPIPNTPQEPEDEEYEDEEYEDEEYEDEDEED